MAAPVEVIEGSEAFADASEALRRAILDAWGWDGARIGEQCDAWKDAERRLVTAGPGYLDRL